jgi:tRNA (mo5U34)-methyltransferase
MSEATRRLIARVPGSRRAATALRRVLSVPPTRADAPPVLINHGVGGDTPPFELRPGVDRAAFAGEVEGRTWFHSFDFGGGVFAHGPDPSHKKTKYLGLPVSFEGMSVLDVGAYDGHYSFEAARRGAADVLATDDFVWNWPGVTARSNFEFVRENLGLAVRDQYISVEKLSPEAVGGQFDVVFFFGVLYHAPDPLGYLKRVRSVTRKYVLIETVVDLLEIPTPALAYYPDATLNGDPTNHFGPNIAAVEGLLQDAGFSRMENLGVWRQHELEIVRNLPLPKGKPRSGRAVMRAWA